MRSALIQIAAATTALAQRGHGGFGSWQHMPGRDWQHVATSGNATFSQLIDHKNPSLGTFEQFYFYDTTYWAGPGSPVVISTPGEINVTGMNPASCSCIEF